MAKKTTRKAKKRNILHLLRESWFYRIYFGLLLICAVALAFGLNTLSKVMAEYEDTRPIYCAQEVLDIINARSWHEVYAMDESAKSLTTETPEKYAAYMEELTAGKTFTLKNVLSLNDDEQKYSVMLDGQKFAELTLEHSGEVTQFGFDRWQVKTLATTAFGVSEYTIIAPADSTVQVNGHTLTQAEVVETGITTEASGNLPDGVPVPTLTKYVVQMSFGSPDSIVVTDRNGNPQELVQDSEYSWSCGLSYDDSIKAQVEESVIKWGRRIAAYTTGDYSKSDLSNACINPSPARTYIRNMENQWAASHSGYDFANITTYDYYVYSNDCFSCKISFDYIVHYKQEDKTYPTNYTLYFAKSGGTFKLYSFTIG